LLPLVRNYKQESIGEDGTQIEGEDEEKENLPDLENPPPRPKPIASPWAGVSKIVNALSPARLFRSTPQKPSRAVEEDEKQNIDPFEANESEIEFAGEIEEDEGEQDYVTTMELQYENGETVMVPSSLLAEMEDIQESILDSPTRARRRLERLPADVHVISSKQTFWTSLTDNRLVDLFRPVYHATKRFFEAILLILWVLFEWTVLTPLLVPWKVLVFIYNSKVALLAITILGSGILYMNKYPETYDKLPLVGLPAGLKALESYVKLPESLSVTVGYLQDKYEVIKASEYYPVNAAKSAKGAIEGYLGGLEFPAVGNFDFNMFSTAEKKEGVDASAATPWSLFVAPVPNVTEWGSWFKIKSWNNFTSATSWNLFPIFNATNRTIEEPLGEMLSWNIFVLPETSNFIPSFSNLTWPKLSVTLPTWQLNFNFSSFNLFPVREPVNVDELLADTAKESLTKRLEQLESALKALNKKFVQNNGGISRLTKLQEESRIKMEGMQSSIGGLTKKLDEALSKLGKLDTKYANVEAASKDSLGALKSDIKILGDKLEGLNQVWVTKTSNLPSQITDLSKAVESVVSRIESLESQTKNLDSKIVKKAREVIESAVPPLLVAFKDPKSGKVEMDPGFFKYLKESIGFAETGEVEKLKGKLKGLEMDVDSQKKEVKKVLGGSGVFVKKDEVAGLVKSGLEGTVTKDELAKERDVLEEKLKSAVGGFASKQAVQDLKKDVEAQLETQKSQYVGSADVEKIMDAYDFGKVVREKVNEVLRGDGGDGKVVVTREEVLEVLEGQLQELVSKVQLDLDSVRHQLGDLETKSKNLKLDTETVKPLIDSLISWALSKFSADLIAKPDYALGSAGAWVVPSLTSATYTSTSESWWGKLLGQKVVRGWGPFYALTPGTLPGQCWALDGT
jgi:predicted  nucleic acid-binding Zn-ribbon protein